MIISTVSLFLFFDFVWIYFIMLPKYKTMINKIQNKSPKFDYKYAACAYMLMVLGLLYFVLPYIENYKDVFRHGTLFGLVMYGVYDFTCASVFEDFDKKAMVYDILWGCFLYTITPLIYLNIKK